MQTIKIILLKTDVMDRVAETTAYTGNKTETSDKAAFFERVATVTGDASILDRYWQDSCAALADSLRSFVREATFGKETFTMTLEVSNSYDLTLTPAAESGVLAIIAASITSRWFRITMPQRAEEWLKEARFQFSALLANLYHRKKPLRK